VNLIPSTANLLSEFTNILTCTNATGTFAQVDATAQKLVKRLDELRREQSRINREIQSIETALNVAGIKPDKKHVSTEIGYVMTQPFTAVSLPEACLMILRDHREHWLSKGEIEYLIVRGGYKFATKDPKNSVGITLQRMKDEGRCDVQTVRGSRGNLYRWYGERRADATSANDDRK